MRPDRFQWNIRQEFSRTEKGVPSFSIPKPVKSIEWQRLNFLVGECTHQYLNFPHNKMSLRTRVLSRGEATSITIIVRLPHSVPLRSQ
jgi:hypothetical protein